MSLKTKNGICAITLTTIASLFVLVSFCTSYWLVNDGKIENPKFIRIGEFVTALYRSGKSEIIQLLIIKY